MSIRGKAAIVGIGEVPTQEFYPGRSALGLAAEAISLALDDAHLTKDDIDGLLTPDGAASGVAEYIGIHPSFASGVSMAGASGATSIAVAAAAIEAGYADTILVAISQPRDPTNRYNIAAGAGASIPGEFDNPYGPAVAANGPYALLYQRHMYEFGTKPEQMAQMAVNQRFNALKNPNAVFQGQLITIEDVLNSRYINEPLHLLECVMPCAGGAACIVTSAEHAKALPNRPVYLLGAGIEATESAIWMAPRITTSPTKVSAANAFKMAGYKAPDMQFAEFYD